MCYLQDKSIFSVENLPIKITDKGQTIVDNNGVFVNVIKDINADAFFEIVFQNLSRL